MKLNWNECRSGSSVETLKLVMISHFSVVAELSEVLWNMVLHLALGMEGVVGILATFVLFAFWAGKSFCLWGAEVEIIPRKSSCGIFFSLHRVGCGRYNCCRSSFVHSFCFLIQCFIALVSFMFQLWLLPFFSSWKDYQLSCMHSVSIGKFFSCIGKPRILYKMTLTPNTGQSKSVFSMGSPQNRRFDCR